jgi:hypothetical protein
MTEPKESQHSNIPPAAEKHLISHKITFPSLEERINDIEMGVLFNGSYEMRRVVITNEYVIFAEVNQEDIIDFIPIADILSVDDLDGVTTETSVVEESQSLAHIASLETVASTLSAFQIRTIRTGYNCGRKYCLQATSDGQCDELIKLLNSRAAAAATQRWIETKTVLERSQDSVRRFYDAPGFQIASASLIVATLILSALEAQLGGDVENDDGSLTEIGRQIDLGNTIITLLFAVELLINLYAHWWRDFFTSSTNVWDLVVVGLSVASLGPLETAMPLTMLRLFRVVRTLRVLKLFVRLPELKKIISALTHSIVPMLNAFLIVLVTMAMCAVVLYIYIYIPSYSI